MTSETIDCLPSCHASITPINGVTVGALEFTKVGALIGCTEISPALSAPAQYTPTGWQGTVYRAVQAVEF
jgi:hypothetical protein